MKNTKQKSKENIGGERQKETKREEAKREEAKREECSQI
jgi:hypothetical protein